jgi:hypothetical protein
MMTQDEIRYSKNINEKVVREAFNEVKERLKDLLDTKNQIEQRSFVLFNGLITLLIAEITAAYYVKHITPVQSEIYAALIPMIICSALSILCLIGSMFGAKYGALGSNPNKWLQKDILCVKPKFFKTILAYHVFRYDNMIKNTNKSNTIKIRLIRAAICLLMLGVLISVWRVL